MSYSNPQHEGRLVLIPLLRDAFASLHVYEALPGSVAMPLEGGESTTVYQLDEVGAGDDRDLFNVPFLLHANGNPWHEANDYFLSLMRDKAPSIGALMIFGVVPANFLITCCSARTTILIGSTFPVPALHFVRLTNISIT